MCSSLKLFVLLAGIFVASIEASTHYKIVGPDHVLLDLMMSTRDVASQNPQRSLECFNYYSPILNEITAEYERSYALCLLTTSIPRTEVDASTIDDRNTIESSAKEACQILNDCSKKEDSVQYFECYANGESQNAGTMYNISTSASDVLVRVREEYRLIENEESSCSTASERAYVEQTASTREELNNCLAGISPVPESKANLEDGQVRELNGVNKFKRSYIEE